MPKKKKEDKAEAKAKAPKIKAISPLPLGSLGKEELNGLRDKINELIEAHNCGC